MKKPAPKKKTPAQAQAAREADARRYARDKKKRIAAERAYKEKKKGDPAYEKKVKARAKVNNAVRDGRMAKPQAGGTCPKCGAKLTRLEAKHDKGYSKTTWGCPRCNPRGARA